VDGGEQESLHMSKLRVLLVSPDFPPAPGGIQTLTHRLARHAHRVSARVVTLGHPDARDFDLGERLDLRRVWGGLPHQAGIAALNVRALTEAARFKPRVVLSMHIVCSPAAAMLKRHRRVRVVQYLHADELRARPGLASFAVRRSDAVVAVSGHTAQLALRAGADRERLHRIPNGVDLPQRKLADRAQRPTVLTVGRLTQPYKGHDVLLSAMPLIRDRVPDVHWVVIGDGPLRASLESRAAEQGLAGAVSFLGALPDRERDAWFDRAHVFAMPSRLPAGGVGGEGFGIVYLEAAAHGLPVVAGNIGGARDAVVHGKTGLLLDPSDHMAVAGGISRLLMGRERAEALGRAGAERAREFAWPAIARQVEDLLVAVAR